MPLSSVRTERGALRRYVVLVPHRDSRRLVEAVRPALFAAGLWGARSFPAVAPLARVSRPLTAAELKALAASLREAARDGKITAGEAAEIEEEGDGGLRFWGPLLDLPPADLSGAEAYRLFSQVVLCAALTPGGVPPGPPLPALPVFAFRAAAVANLAIRPLAVGEAGYSFRWKVGPLFWLPQKSPPVCRGDRGVRVPPTGLGPADPWRSPGSPFPLLNQCAGRILSEFSQSIYIYGGKK
ncbi:MAG: hypothetical protein LBF74_08855 [Treponema sp.]|jgi:hypothetical protein|nr:hypothetical protein [Treponema sp.]